MWRKWVEANEWVIIIVLTGVLLRIPSMFEPYWYGDEGIYLTIGQAVNRGTELYSGIHDNKPPLLYWAATLVNGDQFGFRLMLMVWQVLTLILMARLLKAVFVRNATAQRVALALFMLMTTLPFLEGNIGNAELFFLPFTILAFEKLLIGGNNLRTVFTAGILYGIGGLFKVPAILEMGIWPIVWLGARDKKFLVKSGVLVTAALIPVAISFGYFALRGSGKEYLTAAWAQNIPYLSSWKAGTESGIFKLTNRVIVAGLVALALIKWGRQLSTAGSVGAWGLVALFAALLSGRPYSHYLLQVTPAVAISVGGLRGWIKKPWQIVGWGTVGLLTLAYVVFGFYPYRVVGYYANFASWLLQNKPTEEYFEWFDPSVKTNYAIAEWLMTQTTSDSSLFVWGDQPMVYALSRRRPVGKYIAAYHIKDFKAADQTLRAMMIDPPDTIVSFLPESELLGLKELVQSRYVMARVINGVRIYVLSPRMAAWLL